MKKIIIVIGAVALMALAVQAATQSDVSASGGLSLNSAFVRRGQVLNDKPVLQPALTLQKDRLLLNVLYSMNVTDSQDNETLEATENDLTLAYQLPSEKLLFTLGLIQYQFNGRKYGASTREVFFDFGLPLALKPSITFYFDLDAVKGFYVKAALTYTKEVSEKLTWIASAYAGYGDKKYNAFFFDYEKDAANDANLNVSAKVALKDGWALIPFVQYSALLDSNIKNIVDARDTKTSLFLGGAQLNYTF